MAEKVAPEDGGAVPAALLRRMNGEHKHTNAHAREIKEGVDTTIDQPWEIDPKLAFNDSYVMLTSYVYLLPKLALLWLPMVILTLPYASLAHCYGSCLPVPTDHVRRGVGFHASLLVARILLIPTFVLGLVSLVLDYVFYYLFGGLFFLLFVRDLKQYRASQKVIAPYRGGTILVEDIFVASIGQALRNGTAEHAWSFTTMILVTPWLKYYLNANPLIYPLEERFIQQISTSLKDIGVDVVHEKAREIICRTRQDGRLAKRLDLWRFCPHYPYPPPGRRWANGLQAANIITFVTHVTHAVAEARGVSEKDQWILSNCTERPVWRVMLWYNNPYHFFTGWVEASITNGEPSQTDKVFGGEHPMWLVSCRSPMLSRRDGQIGPGRIDTFFDEWLPTIVNEVRRLARGAEYAASMHQEVVSKDGLSRPAATIGMKNLAADAPPAHKELKAAAKKKRSRLQRALAASIAFSGDKGASDSSGPLASHPD